MAKWRNGETARAHRNDKTLKHAGPEIDANGKTARLTSAPQWKIGKMVNGRLGKAGEITKIVK